MPPGVHDADLREIKTRYATNERRMELFEGFKCALTALGRAGCKTVYLDGSFVTDKPEPGDYDACWEMAGVNPALLDPVLKDFSNKRRRQKDKYGGEFFPADSLADGVTFFRDYFQRDRHTLKPKGIVRVRVT